LYFSGLCEDGRKGTKALCINHEDGEFQSSAFFTLETLSSTSKGIMSPITTTILLSRSTLYELTPVQQERGNEINSRLTPVLLSLSWHRDNSTHLLHLRVLV